MKNKKYKKLNLGGNLLQTALQVGASAIPGIGPVIAPFVPGIMGMFNQDKPTTATPPIMPMNTNIYGKMKHGGVINNNFKQYNTGSHASGQDLPINTFGNPNYSNPAAFVQGKENTFIIDGNPYVMSDVLKNPETNNTINKDAMSINKKYPKASSGDIEQKNALEFKMKRLASINEALKNIEQNKEMAKGGYLNNGGPVPKPNNMLVNNNVFGVGPSAPPLDLLSTTPLPTSLTSSLNNPMGGPQGVSYNTPSTGQAPNPNVTNRQNNSFVPNKDFNFNNIAIALKAAGLGKSFVDSLTPAEKEAPIMTDYSRSDNYIQNTNVDYTQARQNAMAASNVGANVNRSASTNFAQFQGREAGRAANLSDAIANIDMAENNARNQINMSKAQYEQGKAAEQAAVLRQNRIDNQMNEATANLADQKLFTELSQVGGEFNKYENFKRQLANNKELQQFYVNEALAIMNSKYDNFQIDPNFMQKLQSGNYTVDDVISAVNMVQSSSGSNTQNSPRQINFKTAVTNVDFKNLLTEAINKGSNTLYFIDKNGKQVQYKFDTSKSIDENVQELLNR